MTGVTWPEMDKRHFPFEQSEDPSRFRSIHCLLNPDDHVCLKAAVTWFTVHDLPKEFLERCWVDDETYSFRSVVPPTRIYAQEKEYMPVYEVSFG